MQMAPLSLPESGVRRERDRESVRARDGLARCDRGLLVGADELDEDEELAA